MAIKNWNDRKKMSLCDLLSHGDAGKMHNWRQYLQNTQGIKSQPVTHVVDIRKMENTSYLLNGICVSRCEIGGHLLKAPESRDIAYRLDCVYERIFESIRKICHVLSESEVMSISAG